MGKAKVEIHDFYCIQCGKLTIPLPRKIGHLHEPFHRKKLYCPYCKVTINQVEIRTEAEKSQFKHEFAEGKYKTEAEESIKECNK